MPQVIKVLGCIITKNGISAAPSKIDTIIKLPIPQTCPALQEFNGMVNYLSRFVPQLSTLAAPLTELAGSATMWEWRDLHTTAVKQIKEVIGSNAVVQPINYQSADPIYLVTDASAVGVGAWVGQGSNMHEICPAGFSSRKFNNAQQNYSTYNKELLAIVVGLNLLRSVLAGTTFTILTDHKPLVSFKSQIDLLERQARWQQIIVQFDCEIKHIDGLKNYIADALSRIWLNPKALSSDSDFIPQQVDPLPKPKQLSTITTASTELTKPQSTEMSTISHSVSPLRNDIYNPNEDYELSRTVCILDNYVDNGYLHEEDFLNEEPNNKSTFHFTLEPIKNSTDHLIIPILNIPKVSYHACQHPQNRAESKEHDGMHWSACRRPGCYTHMSSKSYGRWPREDYSIQCCSDCGYTNHSTSTDCQWRSD